MSLPKECKRLAEVDFPIAAVSKHAVREKSLRHGHPSTLHLWWARRPLAACRAMLLGLLLPDPGDRHCPQEFKTAARALLPKVQGTPGSTDADLRQGLLQFIGDFANWDRAANAAYLEVSRGLVRAAHGDEPPFVVDPFAGGGSIPLEALRLGCDAFASDLNPVACLILKVMLEDIPRHGPELVQELRSVGKEIQDSTEKELAELYPSDPDGARPIAYLWARTVRCETPNCGAEIPLARSFWLSKKAKRRRALRYDVVRPQGKAPHVKLEIFEPKSQAEVPAGTISRAKATCPCCSTVLPPERVRVQLYEQKGGADVIFDDEGRRAGGALLFAIVTLNEGEGGRNFRLATEIDYSPVRKAAQQVESLATSQLTGGLKPIPVEPLPPVGTLGFRVQRYGMLEWGDLFTARQKRALVAFVESFRMVSGSPAGQLLAILISRLANGSSSLCRWNPNPSGFAEKIEATFSRQALPITWDFAETSIISGTSGDWAGAVSWFEKSIEFLLKTLPTNGQVVVADATASPLPKEAGGIWFTDPPYYDAVPYSDLSDFFFVWLKRALRSHPLLRDPFDPDNQLTPKLREAVQDETKQVGGRPKDRVFFEEMMASAFSEGRRVLAEDGIGSVVFAHKTTEGWEALLSGMIRGGWTITGSWPIATEMSTRLRARESAALATSIHLVCRPRPEDAPIGDWASVLRELPRRVGDWMERLQSEGIRGADLVFACIGPALEIFSRYSRVETADGRVVGLPEYLEKVWEVVGRTALGQVLGTAEAKARNGAAGAVEEDARLTALFLWTLQSTDAQVDPEVSRQSDEDGDGDDKEDEETPRRKAKGLTLIFDVVRRFAQPLGIHLEIWEGRIIETHKGVVRLLPVRERSKQLFGPEGAHLAAERLERSRTSTAQLALFPEVRAEPRPRHGRGRKAAGSALSDEDLAAQREATILDRVHAAMLLQASGRANALRLLVAAEQERGPDFVRLANALSALYPRESDEKRLLDAMLLAVPR